MLVMEIMKSLARFEGLSILPTKLSISLDYTQVQGKLDASQIGQACPITTSQVQ